MRGIAQRRLTAVAASVVAVVAFATGCSSSAKSTSSTSAPGSSSASSAAPGGSSASTSPGSAATGSTLQIGDIADLTGGCLPGPTPDQRNTLNAWQDYVNSHGGI